MTPSPDMGTGTETETGSDTGAGPGRDLAAGLLDRLAERQVGTRPGVRPVLPSRFEPVGDPALAGHGTEAGWREEHRHVAGLQDRQAPGVRRGDQTPHGYAESSTQRSPQALPPDQAGTREPAAGSREVTARRTVTTAGEPWAQAAEAPGVAPAPGLTRRRERASAPARVAPHDPRVPVEADPADAAPNGRRTRDQHLDVPDAPVIPAPMLPPVPQGSRSARAEQAGGARARGSETAADPGRPARRGVAAPTAEPLTVSVSIGRIEVRAPTPAAPAPARSRVHQPRLSLDDYLARPNRGRS